MELWGRLRYDRSMRESEMRRRIEGFLKRRIRRMLVPALGAGVAFGGLGCAASMYGTSVPGPPVDAAVANQDAVAAQEVGTDSRAIDGDDGDAADAADVLAPVVRYAAP
jgi:hypothetical protein